MKLSRSLFNLGIIMFGGSFIMCFALALATNAPYHDKLFDGFMFSGTLGSGLVLLSIFIAGAIALFKGEPK